jgi:hypothetical protein
MDSQGAKYSANIPNVNGLSKAKNRYLRLKKSLFNNATYDFILLRYKGKYSSLLTRNYALRSSGEEGKTAHLLSDSAYADDISSE